MNASTHSGSLDRVLVDLNTQCDFLLPGGALPVANRAEIVPRIRKLMSWARAQQLPVISSLEAHRSGESLHGLPPHCLEGTQGQRKLPFTLMPHRVVLPGDNTLDVPADPFRRCQQIIFPKRCTELLSNPKADRLINALDLNHWVIFGVPTCCCVKSTVLGLLARLHRVVVVKDACGHWSASDGDLSLRQIEAKGAFMVSTDQLISGAMDEAIHAHQVKVSTDDELEQLEWWENITPSNAKNRSAQRPTLLSEPNRASGNGHSTHRPGKNGKQPKPLSDMIPPHLLRSKARSSRSSSKSRRDLA